MIPLVAAAILLAGVIYFALSDVTKPPEAALGEALRAPVPQTPRMRGSGAATSPKRPMGTVGTGSRRDQNSSVAMTGAANLLNADQKHWFLEPERDTPTEGDDGADLLIHTFVQRTEPEALPTVLVPADVPSLGPLEEGDSDDLLDTGSGNIRVRSAGRDRSARQAKPALVADVCGGTLPRIEDFDPTDGDLVLAVAFSDAQMMAAWPEHPARDAQIAVREFKDGTGATILLDGTAVAEVTGRHDLDPAMIRISGTEIDAPDLCDVAVSDEMDAYWQGPGGIGATNRPLQAASI